MQGHQSINRGMAITALMVVAACAERAEVLAPPAAVHQADWRDAVHERKLEARGAMPDSSLGWDQAFVGIQAEVLGRTWTLLFRADVHGRPVTEAAANSEHFARLRTADAGRVLELMNADTVVLNVPVGPAPVRRASPPLRPAPPAPQAVDGLPGRAARAVECQDAWERYASASLGLMSVLHTWAERPASAWRAGIAVAAEAWVSRLDALGSCLFGG